MGYSSRSYASGYLSRSSLPPGVRWLLIINVAIYLLSILAGLVGLEGLFAPFALTPLLVVKRFEIWQLFTYMFLHATRPMHILFNMLVLWMVGKDLEAVWGTRKFLNFYFVCGNAAGVVAVISGFLFSGPYHSIIGASGAIMGLLVAFGMIFPDALIILLIFPIKARYAVMIIAALEFISPLVGSTGVSNAAHIGGLVTGYVSMKTWMQSKGRTRFNSKPAWNPIGALRDQYKEWKLQRAKKKFEVYLRKHGGGGPFVN